MSRYALALLTFAALVRPGAAQAPQGGKPAGAAKPATVWKKLLTDCIAERSAGGVCAGRTFQKGNLTVCLAKNIESLSPVCKSAFNEAGKVYFKQFPYKGKEAAEKVQTDCAAERGPGGVCAGEVYGLYHCLFQNENVISTACKSALDAAAYDYRKRPAAGP